MNGTWIIQGRHQIVNNPGSRGERLIVADIVTEMKVNLATTQENMHRLAAADSPLFVGERALSKLLEQGRT